MESKITIHTLKIVVNNWKKLAIVGLVAIVFSAIISSPLIIKPDYKSTFTLYPTNLMPFSKETGTEQLFQFLSSEEIKMSLTRRFDLFKHYEIDSTEEKAQAKFNNIYNSNIEIKFTPYQSIDVSVIDISPKFAQTLAKAMIEEVNELIRTKRKEKYQEFINLFGHELDAKKKEIDSIEKKLKFMRVNYGLLNIDAQSKIISKKLAKKELNQTDNILLTGLKEYSGEFIILQTKFYSELDNYKILKQTFDKNTIDYNGKLSYTTVVSPPNLPDKKNWPNRLLIIVLITSSSLLLASMLMVLRKKLN